MKGGNDQGEVLEDGKTVFEWLLQYLYMAPEPFSHSLVTYDVFSRDKVAIPFQFLTLIFTDIIC